MNNKLVLGILIFVLVIGVTFFVRTNQTNYEDNFAETSQEGNSQNLVAYDDSEDNECEGNSCELNSGGIASEQIPTSSESGVNLDTLSIHNTINDCWIAYSGKVYDITDYLPRHPGSAGKILPYCGSATEFEQAFTKKHGTSKVNLLMKVGVFIGDFDIIGNIK